MITDTAEAALDYAGRGWPVHPIKSGDKVPILRNWPVMASIDLETVATWLPLGTKRNVGIVTGERSKLVVIDADKKNGGIESFDRLERDRGKLPVTARVATGGGGFHLYLSIPDGVGAVHDAQLPGYPGIDLRAAGNLIVPPSVHKSGRAYQWTNEGPIAPAPQWLIDAVLKPQRHHVMAATGGRVCPEGERSNYLASFAGTQRARGASEAELIAALLAENARNCRPPLSDSEVRDIARSIAKYPAGSPHPDTDVGNARRLVEALAGNARYDHASRNWYLYDGRVWQRDQDGAIVRAAKKVGDELLAQAQQINDPDVHKRKKAFAIRSQSNPRLRAMVELAESEEGIPVSATEFDKPAYLINVRNGTIDLRSGILLPHRREDLLARYIDIDFDANVACPEFDRFIANVFENDAELMEFARRVFGYCATGETREQMFLVLHGEGANGKSTLLKVIADALGPYATHTPTETLLARNGGPSNDIARLMGARFVTASEADSHQRLNESFIKQVTGDEPLTARFLYGEFFQYQPVMKLALATNALPQVNGNDPALFRRLRLIPFNRVFTADEQDKTLGSKLAAELPGIFAWIVSGAVTWYAEGLTSPAAVMHAGAEFRSESDSVNAYIEDRCEITTGEVVQASHLFRDYRRFTEDAGRTSLNQTAFGKALNKRGVFAEKRSGSVYRVGIKYRSIAA